ncbi:hypothetical protein [Psychrobacillus psychrotolerans]|uniref:hypothetical protein n=1 Tax=Psychrobacillus psychrotolerans TaxID=126156 RepID=UPI0011144A24|nr:hypothetical protein [Psychrobacillus psychrotolerans]
MSLRRVTAGAYVFSSDEGAEAKPTESEVVDLAEFNILLYTPRIEFGFVYSLKLTTILMVVSFYLTS